MTITSMMMVDSDDEHDHDDEVDSNIMMPISPPSKPTLQHDSRSKFLLDGGCECPIVVTTNMKDAAKQILNHSFAIYSTKSSTTTTTTTSTNINVAWKAAKEMFSAIDRKDGASNAPKRIIHQGHLHGFNEPSSAKYLYRAFCNSSIQPWPSRPSSSSSTSKVVDDDSNSNNSDERDNNNNFRQASISVATDLHRILLECFDEIKCQYHKNRDVETSFEENNVQLFQRQQKQQHQDGSVSLWENNSSINCGVKGNKPNDQQYVNDLDNKRTWCHRQSDVDIDDVRHVQEEQCHYLPPCRKRFRRTMPSNDTYPHQDQACGPLDGGISIPRTAMDPTAHCPLDYFLYHGPTCRTKDNNFTIKTNKEDSAEEDVSPRPLLPPHVPINCSEHVDRGILIVVCLTNVPGLEVYSRCTNQYYCPEIVSHNMNLYQESEPCPGGLVCIMAGDQLRSAVSNLSASLSDSSAKSNKTNEEGLRACVHRVRDNLKQSRLSISYELRA